MNPVEIEQAVSELVEQPFDPATFATAFLEAFGNKPEAVKRLLASNKSDVTGGVLQPNNIHLAVCPAGETPSILEQLRLSPATTRHKVKFILATDGEEIAAEDLNAGDPLVCPYQNLPDRFGFFLPLAGITTIPAIRENAFDIRATRHLNKLYVELLKDNPEWGTEARRPDMNHFMARLIFCFFAEDTGIFVGEGTFTATVQQMTARDASDTHVVIGEIFRAMNTPDSPEARKAANLRPWANTFPYVNGGLFSGSLDVPRFSRIAKTYLLKVGELDWRRINPDIFGSMIQAVADDEERGALGMHYTSVPNILKVLNPLFLDDLRENLAAAGDDPAKLTALRERMSRIRVFDPACGSGNFLVIAYKQLREIEAEINRRLEEPARTTLIHTRNFRGIEIKSFPAEIARLALIIAEFQCDVLYRGEKLAKTDFLPLDGENWIICGNALALDWLGICDPEEQEVKIRNQQDLFQAAENRDGIRFKSRGGETYICGNPPYLGSTWQSAEQKNDLKGIFDHRCKTWKSLDYVAGWFMKAADYGTHTNAAAAFVSTNSICQGQQVPILWPLIFGTGHEISFACTSFKWANLASHNAGVTVVIVGISRHPAKVRCLYGMDGNGETQVRQAANINPYLVSGPTVIVNKLAKPMTNMAEMDFGNKPVDGGNLLLSGNEMASLNLNSEHVQMFIRPFLGASEFIRGIQKYCLWIQDEYLDQALQIDSIRKRVEAVRAIRSISTKEATRKGAAFPYRFDEIRQSDKQIAIIIPSVSSEGRNYLPVGYLSPGSIVSNSAFFIADAPLWNLALIASRLHLVWIATVCGKLKTDFRYSNTLGWNTFPVPSLTQTNKDDLTRCAEDILIAREEHFPATIADLYDPKTMPENLRRAHDRNDEVLERIYIGRRFKNDTERLEKLFQMYTEMTGKKKAI